MKNSLVSFCVVFVISAFLNNAQGAPAFIFDSDGNRISATGGALNVVSGSALGRAVAGTVRNDYTGTAVTTGAWVQLIASTAAVTSVVELFDSSGQTLELGTGGSGSEARLFIIFPGGNGQVPAAIPSGTRISIRAITATASVGEIDINLYQ